MRDKFKPTKLITLVTVFLLFAFVFTSYASAVYLSRPSVLRATDSTPSAKAKGRDKMRDRLSEVKLKVCEKKEATIQKRATKLVTRAENIQNNFDRIVQRVDDYYVDKVVPKVGEIENYDQMLDKIFENRAAVASTLGLAESSANNFNCEGKDPKGQLKLFRSDMQVVIVALKEYKKAVIDYLVAVKTKARNIKTPTATSSAEPATGSAGTE